MRNPETKSIPSLKDFIFPPEEIKKLVENLSAYYQFCNQDSIQLYKKFEGKTSFKGSFGEFLKLEKIRDLLDITHGKSWDVLFKAIFLVENIEESVDMSVFKKFKPEHKEQILDLITNGQQALEKIKEWLKPLNKENVFQAIKDCLDVSIGNDKYSTILVYKFADVISKPNPDRGIGIFPQILEIDNPNALAEYLKQKSEPIPESLILTFVRNKKHDYKTSIYMFLVFDNTLYILDMTEHRLNLENNAGARSPTKYFEREYEKIWLPFQVFLGNKKTETKEIALREKKIFTRANIDEIFKKSPEISAWLDLMVYRLLDYINEKKEKIQVAVTMESVLRMLEDKTQNNKIEARVKLRDSDKPEQSFESIGDASSYLLKKYETKLTAITVSQVNLPQVIGRREYVENVIKFKQRNELAKALEKELKLDYQKNHKRVYRWFKNFVLKYDRKKLIEKAMLDEKYPILVADSHTYVEGKSVEVKKPTVMKESILTFGTIKNHSMYWGDNPLEIICTKKMWLYWENKRAVCQNCKKFQWKYLISLYFRDYRQIMEFFELKENDLPIEYIQHFHYINESYYGNDLLDDTDPIDSIRDPYFRGKVNRGWHVIVNGYSEGYPHMEVVIPICKVCFNKVANQKLIEEHERELNRE